MVLELRDICKDYTRGKIVVPVLENINLTVEEGEYIAIMGPSGSGKTTLMNLIGCLDQPTSGKRRTWTGSATTVWRTSATGRSASSFRTPTCSRA